ncbi:MAG: helix-turn-helix domain-containing protein, partial [Anaerolineae bacterium]|nr:helix-turn-helix domain-containing protein [Anaerolineae bacterium]NIN98765.1 helix-turn-helix domain-containing protein [Anaerolineae bacterium]NIQ81658.1 helix-turn-helix domain-containing protein [Anaerolineae bacterium]
MSKKECDRLKVLSTACEIGRTNAEVGRALGLSVRHVKRLKKALREEGPQGLAHGNRGRTPRHALSCELVTQVGSLYRSKYQSFNFSHFREKLEEMEGIEVSLPSVRRVLLAAGYRSPRKRRPPKHRSRRERRACEGALLQIDGSHHDWLEGRGPRMCLLAAIDDATGKVVGALSRQAEDAHSYFLLMREVIGRHGIPEAIYRDRYGVFQRNPKEAEDYSPQAK